MDIRIKEGLFIHQAGGNNIIRQGTCGVEKDKVVYFYDVTKTIAVGFSRDFCLENPHIFQVSRAITDKDISMRDVLEAVDKVVTDVDQAEQLKNIINTL